MIFVMLYTYKALGDFQNLFSLAVDHLILVPILWSKQDIIPLSLEIDFKIIFSGGSSLFGKFLCGATVHKSDTSGSLLVQLEDWRGWVGLALCFLFIVLWQTLGHVCRTKAALNPEFWFNPKLGETNKLRLPEDFFQLTLLISNPV